MLRIGQVIIRCRWVFLGLVVALFFCSSRLLPHLGFSFSLMPLLESDEDTQASVDAFQGDVPPKFYDQIFAVEFPKAIASKEIGVLQKLHDSIKQNRRVQEVTSLASVLVVNHFGPLPVPTRFFSTVRDQETALVAAARHPLLGRRLISADGRSATFLVLAKEKGQDEHAELLNWLEVFVSEQLGPEIDVHFIGDEVSKRAMKSYMGADMKRGLLLELLVFAILLPLIFRTFRGIIIPLTVVIGAQLFCLSILVLAGMEIGLIDMAVPGIITMITVCDAVHMMHRFEESLLAGNKRDRAILDMMESIGPACFFTSLTTAIGFLSLLVADHPAVRLFGIKASVAVLIAFVAIVTIVPTFLSFWPIKKGVLARVPGFSRLGYGRRKLTFVVFGSVLAIAIFGISQVNIDSHWLEEMPAEEPLIQELKWYEDNFSGIMSLDVRIEGDLSTLESFHAIQDLQARLLEEKNVNKAESYTHWLEEAAGHPKVMRQSDVDRAFHFLKIGDGTFPYHAINSEQRVGRLTFLTDDSGTKRFFELRELVDKLNRDLPPGLRVEVGGFMEMAHEASRLIVTTMLESFLVSLLAISILISFIFRSIRVGLVSIVPNVFPILVALGVNGLLGINLRIGIVMIYSLGLGLAVDDTIHLITRYRQERKKSPREARRPQLLRSIKGSGPALITTSIVLGIGSLSYLPSSFRSLRDVGVLLTTVVITALLADLFLLPHLLEMAGKPRKKSLQGRATIDDE
ncbi:MAG: putative RND superfamily exporter protein [Planctomycetota bacterium]|jgi:predicted RND superfamily exporter protein